MSDKDNSRSVLVLDGDMPPALAIARSLGQSGLSVTVGSHVPKPIAGYSRYATSVATYPDPLENESAFVEWCTAQLGNDRFDLIIPVTERTVVPMSNLWGTTGSEKMAVAPPFALSVALDKNQTMDLASKLGISTPSSHLVETEADLAEIADTLSMPVVIKPARSIGGSDTERKQLTVDYAFEAQSLKTKSRHYLRFGAVLLQEYKTGEGVGIELIADQGRIAFAFQHLRLHEVPLTGGGSSLRKSVPIEHELLDAADRLMQALSWHGVAMVEFKWEPDTRSYSLMEINGRFWGSLPLAIAAGADFPLMLHELLTEGRIKEREPARPNIYCRKLSSDLYWHELAIRKIGPPEIVSFPSWGKIFKDLGLLLSLRHHYDIQQWRDPYPGLIDLGRVIGEYASRAGQVFRERRAIRSHRRAWKNGDIKTRIRNARRIMFVCYGNINRSILAEKCFRQATPAHSVDATSTGFHQKEGRPADPVMIEIAGDLGVDLNGCSSRTITQKELDESDVVFVMEMPHFERIAREFPSAREKTFLLGAGCEEKRCNYEISDPFGLAKDEYRQCAHKIQARVRQLANYL